MQRRDRGDGFTILKSGTDRLGGDVDVDALGKYLGLPGNDRIAPTPRNRITLVP
jgi:5'-nucleotidase